MEYTKIGERGRGGFGVVDEVMGEDGMHYARKSLVVPPNLDVANVRRRFEREVKYQGAIENENVVSVLDFDLDDNPPWFIMPLALHSLEDELQQDHTLGGHPKTALFHILNGLEEIHRRGF